MMLPFLSRPARQRVRHDQAVYAQPDFAAQYSADVGKQTGDFRLLLDDVQRRLDPSRPADVLEIGPGPGWIGIRLAQSHPLVRVTGLDVSPAFVEIASEHSRREGVAERVTFTLGDAIQMGGLPDQSFDLVMSYQSLHYWEPVEAALNEIDRVLRPSGAFVLADDRRDMNWLGRLEVVVKRQFISRRVRAAWADSISGCLTLAEAADAMQRSALRDRWQVTAGGRSMLITSRPAAK